MKKLFGFFSFVVIIGIGTILFIYTQIQQFKTQPIHVTSSDQLLTIQRGTTGQKLAHLFEQEKLLDNATLLPYLLKLTPELNKIKAGTYSLAGITTVESLLQRLNSGKEAQFSIQFIEGDTFKTWRKTLENAPHLHQTLQQKTEQEIFALLDIPYVDQTRSGVSKLEGWLYPDTYHYTAHSTDLTLLKRAVERMKNTLTSAWQQRDKDLPLNTPYDMLILASIVEKESAVATERGKIASVFINRLNKKMRLQTDPTVIYGMGEKYNGNIRKKDLETMTPYNTYLIDGLPPTPIAMPSESALMAVAKPEKTDFLYFVADGSGGHTFSKTLAEHNRAVQQYLQWYRTQQNGK